MPTISPATAIKAVRKNLDELDPNGSIMYQSDDPDNTSMDETISRFLPEAINEVQIAAPIWLLSGESYSASATSITGGCSFTIPYSTGFLRLVSFKGTGSDIIITEPILASSMEGRKQANQYIRGTADRPRLLVAPGGSSGFLFYAYGVTGIESLYIIKEQTYNSSSGATYTYSGRLLQNIIDMTTAHVLETYNDNRAQSYYQRALNFKV